MNPKESVIAEAKEVEVKAVEKDVVPVITPDKVVPKFAPKKDIGAPIKNVPEHIINLARIVKDNAEIRRYTSLIILNYLRQKGEINGKKGYVEFFFNKFSVKVNGLSREYRYTETFFIKALVASFTCFASSATKTINYFLSKELEIHLDDVVDDGEANELAAKTIASTVDSE